MKMMIVLAVALSVIALLSATGARAHAWKGDIWIHPEGENPVDYRISYPDVYEHNPGEVWITTGQGMLRIKFLEDDFVEG